MTSGSKKRSINNNQKTKKMKGKNLIVALAVGVFGVVNTKAQNVECNQNLSIFSEYAKVQNYDEAYEPWKAVYKNCPQLHYATFAYGERILKHKISKATAAEKAKYVKDLEQLYDDYNKYFPQRLSVTEMRIRKALLMFDEKAGTSEDIYALLDQAFKEDKANFKNEKALYLYFSELVNLHGKNVKSLQNVFDTYDDVSEKIQDEKNDLSLTINQYIDKEDAGTLNDKEKKALENARKRMDNYEKISESVDGKLGQLADCPNLIPLYTKGFDENKSNEEWLRRAAGKMTDKDCTSDPLYVKIVTALHNLSPSASSAYYLGVLTDKGGNPSKAIQYYNEAVSLETDNFKKAKILTKIAQKSSKATAVSYAQKALNYNPSNSDAYRIIAQAYANSANECGSTPFEKRAIYWLAANVARKGGLGSLATYYEGLAPSKVDIFESGMAGKTITFKCWVGQSVKVPSL
ncbi:Conserved hypothetical protein [Capnocytophaga canimorsus Cc5]|uniref:Uncharacterized protein n=2 Tax=Capnocytophaga canimorsus TaxID=28188 RepID=F9YQU0_CAPCC|nr:Conserved hypothetical protein [Capnocytophaga canimorsus Cc5]